MTPEQLAARWLADTVRYAVTEYGILSFKDGVWIRHDDALAAIARHLAPEERPDAPCHIVEYTNYRGETARRVIIPIHFWWGSTEWHPEEQWMLSAWDVEKNARRDFAWQDMRPIQNGATSAAVAASHLAPGDDLVAQAGKYPEILMGYSQGDMDGVMALISRQALHEAADTITALLARLSALTAHVRESAMQALASMGQAQEAYEAQLAAEAEAATLRDRLARMEDRITVARIHLENEAYCAARAALTDGGSNG